MFKNISRSLLRQYAVIITVNLLALCAGLDLGWSSPVLVKLQDPAQTPLSRPITEDEGQWIVSIGFIFSIFTIMGAGLLIDWLGRRYMILVASLPKIIAGVITIFATEVWVLLIARVIYGITTTAAMIVIMKEIRGSLGSIIPIFTSLGVLVVLSIGPYISYLNLCIMVTAVTVFVSIPLLFVPDTPFSLYNKGKLEEAEKVLIYFRGSKALAEDELKELSRTKPTQNFDRRELIKNKTYLKSLVIAIVLNMAVPMTGFNCIVFYLESILELTNTSISPALGSVVIGFIQILCSIFASLVVDKFGRRPILIWTLIVLAMGMIGLGTFFMVKQNGVVISGFLNYLPLICIGTATCCYSGGIGCLYFVVVSELLDDPIRATGSSMAAVVTNIVLFLLTRYIMSMISAMGPGATFTMFGVVSVLVSAFVFFFIPETKQKSIAEIQLALGGLDGMERDKKRENII